MFVVVQPDHRLILSRPITLFYVLSLVLSLMIQILCCERVIRYFFVPWSISWSATNLLDMMFILVVLLLRCLPNKRGLQVRTSEDIIDHVHSAVVLHGMQIAVDGNPTRRFGVLAVVIQFL